MNHLRHEYSNYKELLENIPKYELGRIAAYLKLKERVHDALQKKYPEFDFEMLDE